MRWTEQAPDLPFRSVSMLASRAAIGNRWRAADDGVTVLAPCNVRAAIGLHLGQSGVEQGGLLLGEVFTDAGSCDPERTRAVLLTQAIRAEEFSSSGISLRMESNLWERARSARGPHELVVGWYHSHPGLGAFFSSTDRHTQAAFFNQPYSVGWVLDTLRGEEAVFVGAGSAAPAAFIRLRESVEDPDPDSYAG
jgi:proteasome lid subunit RPN8/RPN11